MLLAAFCSQHSVTFVTFYCIVKIMPCFGERSKACPNISAQNLVDAMSSYMQLKGCRDIVSLFNDMKHCQYTTRLPLSLLLSYSDFAKIFAKVCTAGVLPSKKFRAAMEYMNAEVKPGFGIMKINFSGKPDQDVWDYVDDKVKIILKNFRELRQDPDKLNALYLKIPLAQRLMVEEVINEMTEVPVKPGRPSTMSADSALLLDLPVQNDLQIAFCFADQYYFLYYTLLFYIALIFCIASSFYIT